MKKFGIAIAVLIWATVALLTTLAGYGQAVGVVCIGVFMVLVIGLLDRIARGLEALKPPSS